MQMRRLGKNGPEVAPIGYGAMSFSDFYGPTTESASHAILDLMRDRGANHLDTSNIYGNGRSETWIGSYLAANTWTTKVTATSTHSPLLGKWGDYVVCRAHPTRRTSWIASGFTLQGGQDRRNVEPRVVVFRG